MQHTTKKPDCYVIYEKLNGLVGIQKREDTFDELPDYLYVKDSAFRKTEEYRELEGQIGLVYTEIE